MIVDPLVYCSSLASCLSITNVDLVLAIIIIINLQVQPVFADLTIMRIYCSVILLQISCKTHG